jgi:3'(2'), 5'-bisphosphate nucleotidase
VLELKDPQISFLLQAVQRASWLVRQVQADLVAPAMLKQDHSPVTVADFASQAVVASLLSQYFPGDVLVGEEDSHSLQQPGSNLQLAQVTRYLQLFTPQASPQQVCAWIDRGASDPQDRYWVIDPIDGTKGFLRGGQYAVALALVEEGQVQLGALGCPSLDFPNRSRPSGFLFIAARGAGAWQVEMPPGWQLHLEDLVFTRLRVSAQPNPPQARLLRSFEASHTNQDKLDRLTRRLLVEPPPSRLDSQVKYALLAAGQGDVLVKPRPASNPEYREKIWDHVAGMLLVEEAGGLVTDLDGLPLDLSAGRTLIRNRGILATNALLHPAFLEAIQALGI